MLESIKGPSDLKALRPEQLDQLSEEIRQFLITKVSKTGGHLGPNLGVVELTIAIHRTFDSPKDVVLFDTGHQSYVHKILTGRADQFDKLRQRGGIAGYPNRRESEHDVIENSHASTALSWGDGISRGFSLTGQSDRHVVVVVGDGALFDYLEEIDSDFELDVIALCCEYSEDLAEDIAEQHNIKVDSIDELEDAVRAHLEENTSIVAETASGFLYAQF